MTEFVMVPLSGAPYPRDFLDALNGYATGGSGRCREIIEAEGAWIEKSAASPQPVVGDREAGRTFYEANRRPDPHGMFARWAEWDDLPPEEKLHYATAEKTLLASLASRPEGGD